MNYCIKTGAWVWLEVYGEALRCDVFRIYDSQGVPIYIFNAGTDNISYGIKEHDCDFIVESEESSGYQHRVLYFRSGYIVASAKVVVETKRLHRPTT